tara:strand:+ start:656 stop:1609 length:954 start_codon:yes stop_codon:yes gene_type:complete
MKFTKNTKKVKGDASFRSFYRIKKKSFSSIIVHSKKDKKLNLLIYDAVNKILIKNNIQAPKLISENYSKNFIEIEDFGNQTILEYLKRNKKKKYLIFKKIIKLLQKVQLIKNQRILNFKKKYYIIPKYSSKILFKEAQLFSKWYSPKILSRLNQLKFQKEYEKLVRLLLKKIKLKNDVFVHRDFHISNLMLIKNEIGLIDSQDALFGNRAYDLASLIDDVRFKSSKIFKKKLFNLYLKSQENLDTKSFKNDFEIISVLRNLKIIGIFTRLAIRDNKKNYLKFIPYTWSLINYRTKNNKVFSELKLLLSKNFKYNMIN